MKPFDYIAARSLGEIATLLSRYGSDATLVAGGTDLLVEYRRPQNHQTAVLIDISRVGELGGMSETGGLVSMGPLTTHALLHRSPLVRMTAPLLSTAAATIGSPQIRNRGTIGGNIMNAAACADTVPPLVALGATVTLHSAKSSRQLPLADLFIRPYQTCAAPDELLTEIRFPALASAARSAFIKLGRRNALSISRLSVAAILCIDDDSRITDARIVAGAAFPIWQRVSAAEELLQGQRPCTRLFTAAGASVAHAMITQAGRRWSSEYKEPVLAALVRRALEQCAQMTPSGETA